MPGTNQGNRKPTLGVVAISFNEARDMPGFLNNLIPWVDEVVIVDDGSSDATADLARAAGDKVNFIVSSRAPGEYFSHQRNKGIDAANSDWLLHMDIDERVTPELADEILEAVQSRNWDACRYRRLNFFLHRPMRGGGWQHWNLVHLARREVLRFGGMFHEDCIVSVPDERIGQLKHRMWHLNDDSYAERMRKSSMYCEEEARNIAARGTRLRWWHLLMLPAVEFVRKYFIAKGFRDGVPGLMFAMHAATARFRAVALVWDRQNPVARESVEARVPPPGRVDDR